MNDLRIKEEKVMYLNFVHCTGGWHASTENTNKVERYDVQSNTWEFKASMCERRYRPGTYSTFFAITVVKMWHHFITS